MCKNRKQIEKELNCIVTDIWQEKPYTAARVTARHLGERQYIAHGFAKVCWPDWWNRKMGITIARGKAVSKIARRIMDEQQAEKCAKALTFHSAIKRGLEGFATTMARAELIKPLK